MGLGDAGTPGRRDAGTRERGNAGTSGRVDAIARAVTKSGTRTWNAKTRGRRDV